MSSYTLAIRENRVFVVCYDTMDSQPTWRKLFWPATMSAENAQYWGLSDGQSLECSGSIGNALFLVKSRINNGYVRGFGAEILTIELIAGPKTLPAFTETGDLPKPKGKFPTKYERGSWWKYLKTKGWVKA